MLVPNLPPNVHDLLRAYIDHSGLRELPLPFTLRNATALHTTTHGVPITYKHRDTGETLQVNSYPWNSPTKKQQVVVATGRSLPEPVIIVPLQKRSSELKIWKGEHNPDGEDVPCPIYKVFGKEKPTGLTGPQIPPAIPSNNSVVPEQKCDITRCRCGYNVEDGEMVMCEECDTWQHVVCYYPNELVPAVHFCEDCGSKYQDAKHAAKRRKVDHNAASANHDPSDAIGRLASTAFPNVTSKVRGREANSDDEPLIPRGIKIEIDLTDDPNTKVKTEPRDDHLTEGARPLLSRLISPISSSSTNFSIIPATSHLMTPTITPALTPQPPPSTPTSLEASQLVDKATTFVFLDSHNRELRRRTFEELGGRFNVGALFGQAVRAGLISKSDSAILSVTIRGISETFAILKDDKPDFARLMRNIEAAGLCMVEVRLD